MVALLMWGGWSKAEEHTIVVIFGCALGGFIAAMTAVIVGLLAGGPVGRDPKGRDAPLEEAERPVRAALPRRAGRASRRPSPIIAPRPTRRAADRPTPSGSRRAGRNQRKDHQ
jgi:pimeloyl-ACP methyl ester carboxylesterase